MERITVNGVEYAPVNKVGRRKMLVCVDNRGLLFQGEVDLSGDSEQITIYRARCVICWGTTAHVAEIVLGPTEKTILGAAANVVVFRRNLVFAYECGGGW